jgi:hypothetical protein
MATALESRGRWALLIGIDRYPNFGSEWQLDGCGNDVAIVHDTLSRRFGFRTDQIEVLRDEQATRDGILAAMEALVDRAGKDDEVVFFYSGHGSQQPDGPEKDEADGYDETLVPCDSGRISLPNRDISDDEVYLWLLRLTARTPFVTLIFDCCNSGTILRDGFAGKSRSAPREERPVSGLAARVPPEAAELLAGGEDSPAAMRRLGDKYVALSACGSEETANEILVGEEKRLAHGALTYHLVKALMDPGFGGATWREVFERVAPQVTAFFRTQHPAVEGARDREVFGVHDIPPMTYLSVDSRVGDTVILGAGKVCGLTLGSQWQVYAPATRSLDDDAKLVGAIEISAVGVTSSKALVVKEERPGEIRAGTRAVESARSLVGVRLAVEIVAPSGHPSAVQLEERIGGSTFLRKASAGEPADARVYLVGPRGCAKPTDPAPMVGPLTEETWVPVGRDGDLLAPAFPRKHPKALESLIQNLENVARLRALVGIRNAGSPLEEQIDFQIYRLEEGRCVDPVLEANGEPVFFEKDRLVFKIRNRSKSRLYVYVLDIGLTGKVAAIFPALGSHECLERGHEIQVGVRMGEDLQLFIPQDFHLLCRAPEGAPVEGRETLKLFATPSPADFNLLFMPPMRFPRAAGWALGDILNTTFHGGYGNLRTSEDWATFERSFRLRSRNTVPAMA